MAAVLPRRPVPPLPLCCCPHNRCLPHCVLQEGATSQALTELNELELDLRGNPETHAALAAVLYIERPAQRWRAEQQWDIAVGFDRRYEDVGWVQENKHWPPRLLEALDKFLSLR